MKKIILALLTAVFLLQITPAIAGDTAPNKAKALRNWNSLGVEYLPTVTVDECLDFLYDINAKKDEDLSNAVLWAIHDKLLIKLGTSFSIGVGVIHLNIKAQKKDIKQFMLGR